MSDTFKHDENGVVQSSEFVLFYTFVCELLEAWEHTKEVVAFLDRSFFRCAVFCPLCFVSSTADCTAACRRDSCKRQALKGK